jgi:NitT/TauT family transport system substrate-binding protein
MGRLGRLTSLLAVVAACALPLAACGSSDDDAGGSSSATSTGQAAGKDLKTVKVGYVAYTGIAPTQLGIDKGIFAKHGLKLETSQADNPAAVAAQVLSGHLDVGFATTTFLATAASKGAPLQAIAAVDGLIDPKDAASGIVVKQGSSIKSPKDLTGKKVAVVALGSELDLLMRVVVDRDGGDSKKVQAVQIPFPQMQAALKSGRVDAIVTTEPFFSASKNAGGQVVSEPEVAVLPNGSVTAYVASKKFINSDADTVKAFSEAMAESLDYAKAHKDQALAVIPKLTGMTADEVKGTALGTVYDPKLDVNSIEQLQNMMVQYKFITKKTPIDDLVGASAR